jgi:hypothetical protein
MYLYLERPEVQPSTNCTPFNCGHDCGIRLAIVLSKFKNLSVLDVYVPLHSNNCVKVTEQFGWLWKIYAFSFWFGSYHQILTRWQFSQCSLYRVHAIYQLRWVNVPIWTVCLSMVQLWSPIERNGYNPINLFSVRLLLLFHDCLLSSAVNKTVRRKSFLMSPNLTKAVYLHLDSSYFAFL